MKSLIVICLFIMLSTILLSQNQIEIDSVIGFSRDAIRITHATDDGIYVNSAGNAGFRVNSAFTGFSVISAQNAGLYVNSADAGLYVLNASSSAVEVNTSLGDGINIGIAGDDGFTVGFAGGDGIEVNDADGYSMNIQGVKSASSLQGHIGRIYNKSTSNNADVLALQIAGNNNPTSTNNYISFYKGPTNIVGEIQGNGSGTLCMTTGGCDYAEYLSKMDHNETFNPGDLVGVYQGKISKQTLNAERIMVITDQAAILGNKPITSEDEQLDTYEPVSFIGQVRTKIKGPVQSGDWIVPSGNHDGIGIAISPQDIQLHHQIVGQAWESASDPGVKRVNTAVGLDQSTAKDVIIRQMKEEVHKQKAINENLQDQIDALKKLVTSGSNLSQVED